MVIRSILTQTEISFFAKVYGIGLVSNFEPLEGGSENSNYVLETMKGKYILTISEDVGLDQLSNLVHLYDHLNENQFPTSIIMRGLDGKSITDYKGKPAILKNFIKGTIVKNPSPQILFQIGVLAAKLHKIPLTKGIQDKFPYGISHFHQAQSWDINNSFINWLKKKAEFLANNLRTDLPKGLVHGDIFGDNLIQCQGGVVALIDF
ncbi:MAG: phosphotransferase, partial [Candidatus Heimdallarchaeota archaeon]|nr:phosphotransferase [Candidatus Heimdallarchaeota archaeon]